MVNGKANGKTLGIDIGGTFTDCVLIDPEGGIQVAKVPSSRTEQARCVMDGWRKLGVDGSELAAFLHGSTAGTNALIERRVGRGALVTTKGMRDILTFGRGGRGDMYNLQWEPPVPLIDRKDVFEVTERLMMDGSVAEAFDEEQARIVAETIRQKGYEAVGVVFLHSYRNSAHEDRMKQIILEACPNIMICTSNEILPQYREFERTNTTVVNTVLMPIVTKYVEDLADRVREAGFAHEPLLMQGSGGLMTPKVLSEWPARLVGSGPAGGVMGCARLAGLAGFNNVITMDMGGTSTDVSLIIDGEPRLTNQLEVEFGVPVLFPAVDVRSVGAGGGSIGWIDADGSFKVGPTSAGAEPGPACYGQGGINPTVTDAQVILGRLDPDKFLGGDMKISLALAEQAMKEKLADPLGMSVEEAARGVLQINTNNIINAVRVATVERGYDPRESVLFAYGGGGPMFGAEVARQMNISEVIVPPNPGLMCALGIALADHKYEVSATLLYTSNNIDYARAEATFQDLEQQIDGMLEDVGIAEERRGLRRWLDLRYEGQAYELSIPASNSTFNEAAFHEAVQRFHAEHLRQYGYKDEDSELELVYVRVFGEGRMDKPDIKRYSPEGADVTAAVTGKREVHFADFAEKTEVTIYDRIRLKAGNRVAGPAVLEEMDSTIIVPPGMDLDVDEYLNLVIHTNVGAQDRDTLDRMAEDSAGSEHVWQVGTVSKDNKDPVLTEVMRNAFLAVVDEMNVVMEKACLSPANKEAKDLSGVLSDRDGHIVCQGWRNIPIHCGTMERTVTSLVAKHGVENFREGDGYIVSDPFFGGSHIQDVRIVMPAFYKGQLLGFLTSCGHWSDVGGYVPGSYTLTASECYAEGLRWSGPLAYRDGEMVGAVVDVIAENTRVPRMNLGDMAAEIAATKRGCERLAALAEKYGPDAVIEHMTLWQDDSTALVHRTVQDVPDGRYEWEEWIDQDPGSEDKHPLRIKLAVIIEGDQITFDFTGTDSSAIGCMNCSMATTDGAAMVGLKCVFPLPFNYGTMKAVKLIAPPGSIVNALKPSNTQANWNPFTKIVDCVLGAFSQVTPERVIAGCGNLSIFVWGTEDIRREDKRYCVGYFWQEVGYGAAATKDGITPRVPLPAGWANTVPVEVLERESPVMVESVMLRQDSAGPGEHRGSNGVQRIFRFLSDGKVTLLGDRAKFAPQGLFGGKESGTQECYYNPGTPEEQNLGWIQEAFRYKAGDRLTFVTAGGGGRGLPTRRDPEAVREDVTQGHTSVQRAREEYGVVLKEEPETALTNTYTVDLEATDLLRAEMVTAATAGD